MSEERRAPALREGEEFGPAQSWSSAAPPPSLIHYGPGRVVEKTSARVLSCVRALTWSPFTASLGLSIVNAIEAPPDDPDIGRYAVLVRGLRGIIEARFTKADGRFVPIVAAPATTGTASWVSKSNRRAGNR